jgi:hypothetical protein
MSTTGRTTGPLDVPIAPVKLKLAALWTATMFLFAYGDIFTMYRSKTLEDLSAGKLAGFHISQTFLMAISVYVAIPSVMIFLSLALRPAINRWANITAGGVYAVTIALSAIGESWAYFIFLSVVEVALVLLIVWHAWTWPGRTQERIGQTSRPGA